MEQGHPIRHISRLLLCNSKKLLCDAFWDVFFPNSFVEAWKQERFFCSYGSERTPLASFSTAMGDYFSFTSETVSHSKTFALLLKKSLLFLFLSSGR